MKFGDTAKLSKRAANIGILFLLGYILSLLALMYFFVGYAQ